ncbi:MAG: glycosyltransferase family 2 protein [Devosia sp.]
MKKLISIIVPVYNEQDNIQITYDELKKTTASLDAYDFEFIFTDNHSTDQTFAKLARIAEIDPSVRVARFARNFGFQKSVLTGYLLARGAAAIQIDADLQDPPAMFGPFLAKWEEGFDVVVGVRGQRHEGTLLYHGRRLYYRLMIKLAGEHLIADAGDFRLIDRSIIEKLRLVDDVHIYLRGLISSLARNQTGIGFDRHKRLHNESKFRFRSLMTFALDGIMAHSSLPLRLAFYIGLLTACGSVLLGAFYLLNRIFGDNSGPEGFATTQVLILLGIGLNGLFLGVIGAYIGRIYDEVRSRHTAVVAQVLNFDGSPEAVESSIRLAQRVET